MRTRSLLGALLLGSLVVPVTSCSDSPSLTSIVITPSVVTVLLGPCGSEQVVSNFTAMGYYTHPGHIPITRDITDEVSWMSYDTQLVTVSSTGVTTVTTCADPTSTVTSTILITASANGFHGLIVGSATFNEQEPAPTTTPAAASVRSITIEQPAHVAPNADVELRAVGRTGDGTVVPLARGVRWTSTDNLVATVDEATGHARTSGMGRSTITAVYTNPDGSTAVGISHLNVDGRI